MPTIDELASQVAALEQQMAAITTPPDKYYTSIYSGEEIDAAITKVRSGAMGVSSFNGRAGAVMPQAGDYNATQIPVSADTGAETVAAALANKMPIVSNITEHTLTTDDMPLIASGIVSFARIGNIVSLRINISPTDPTTYGASYFTLPEGFRPVFGLQFPISAEGAKCGYSEINTLGNFTTYQEGLVGYLSASLCYFTVDDPD